MLLTMVDVISCENSMCKEFARIVPSAPGAKSYYCPICGSINYPRLVDAALADSPAQFEAYLRAAISPQTPALM